MACAVLRPISVAACAAGFILLVSGLASANPIIPSDLYVTSEWAGVLYLFIVNLPVNLFAYSLSLALVCMTLRSKVGNIAAKLSVFMTSVVVACVGMAIVGAFIDFYLLFERTSGDWAFHGSYDFRLDVVKATAACLLIFASIFIVSITIVHTSMLAGVAIGLPIAAVNLAIWYALTWGDMLALEESYWLSLLFFALLAIPVHMLIRWHSMREVPS